VNAGLDVTRKLKPRLLPGHGPQPRHLDSASATANVENSADSATALGSYSTSNGVAYPSAWEDISAYTEQKQLIRFGWLVKNTSGSTRTWSRVGGFMEISDS